MSAPETQGDRDLREERQISDDLTDADGRVDPARGLERLASLRSSIDNIDAALIHLLAERFKCTQTVGRLKAEYGLPPADPTREAEQIARLRSLAESAHLDPGFAEKFLAFIIEEVIRHHKAIAAATEGLADPAAATDSSGTTNAPSATGTSSDG